MVLDQPDEHDIGMLSSIYKTLKSSGLDIYSDNIHVDTIPATAVIANALDIPEGDSVIRMQRLQFANEEPISIITNYLNPTLVPNFEHAIESLDSLYELLETEYDLKIDSTHDIISAKSADFTESGLLQIKCGEPLITIKRTTYSNKTPLTYDENTIRAVKFQYEIRH